MISSSVKVAYLSRALRNEEEYPTNRWFIANAQNMPGEFVVAAEKKLKKVPYAADYLEIKDLCKKVLDAGQYDYKSFPDLSYTA